MKAGVLALQGDFREHARTLEAAGATPREVRVPAHLAEVDCLVIPGGESTAIAKLARAYGLVEPVRERAAGGMPVFGTCAGMIALANEIEGGEPLFGLMDIAVRRNAYGRQVDSFEADLNIKGVDGDKPFHAIFIRAPLIESVGKGVEVLARVEKDNAEVIVAARQGNLLVTSFHPELSHDVRFHRYFVKMAEH